MGYVIGIGAVVWLLHYVGCAIYSYFAFDKKAERLTGVSASELKKRGLL